MRATVASLSFTLLLSGGCERHFFRAHGKLASEGGSFGDWASTPQGCSRDPSDGRPDGESATVASFFWENPAARDAKLRENFGRDAPDAPFRLDMLRDGGGFAGRLQTVKTPGTLLDRTNCVAVRLEGRDQAAAYQAGRPTLSGVLTLDCRVRGSHITAQIQFDHCEY